MTTIIRDWFAVNKEGLAALLARRGKGFALLELIQNALDENITIIRITLESIANRAAALLVVEDDSPDGWADLRDSYTLFARSNKIADAEKRGRFNLGEKLVLAICDDATITSTRGGVRFDSEGRHTLRTKRDAGSEFKATIRMNRAEVAEALAAIGSVIIPSGVKMIVNGKEMVHRIPVHTFEMTLPTELADDEGKLRPTKRKTTVNIYEPREGEAAYIYEMGIPVVENGDRFEYDVQQKVPLNMDRDNVTPAYLRQLRTEVLNQMHDRITEDEATGTWVKEAIADPNITPEAAVDIVHKLFGKDAVVFDPNDLEANVRAASEGRHVIGPRSFTKEAWTNIRNTGQILPAGRVTPSNSTIEMSADGKPPIAEEKWTPGMRAVVEYSKAMGKVLLGADITVDITSMATENFLACYGGRHLMFNVGRLGHKWFNELDQEKVDALIIHEFGHHSSGNHLSKTYLDVLCDLGAKLAAACREGTAPVLRTS